MKNCLDRLKSVKKSLLLTKDELYSFYGEENEILIKVANAVLDVVNTRISLLEGSFDKD